MDFEDDVTSIGARLMTMLVLDSTMCIVKFDYIMATDRQKYAEEKYENLKRKYKQLKLRFNEELALGEDLKSAIQSPISSEKGKEIVNDMLWLCRTSSIERIKEEQRNHIAKRIIGAVRDENEQEEEEEQEEEKN